MNRRRGRDGSASREPIALGDAVADVNRMLGMPEPTAVERVISAWIDVAGPALAAHATVRSVRDGTCTIEVDAPGWATQIRYLESTVVARVSEVCGPGVVRALRVVVRGPGSTG